MRTWSIIVASETCLCLKSYLCRGRIWSRQISRHVRQISGDGSGDLAGQLFVNGPRRVSPNARTEDGGTSVIARVRHMG